VIGIGPAAMAAMTRRVPREIACCASGAACGLAGLALVVLWLLPSALASVTVLGTAAGLAGLAGGLRAARRLAGLQRRALARFAGPAIDAPPQLRRTGGALARLSQRLRDRAAWRAVAYLVIRLPVTVVQGYVVAFVACGVTDLLRPSGWSALPAGVAELPFPLGWPALGSYPPLIAHPGPAVTPFPLDLVIRTGSGTLLAGPVGAALLAAAALLARPAVAADAWLARALLGPASSDRRVRQLERTRSLAVDGAAATLRQVERNLHDGAQVRLTSVALHLGMAREKAGADTPDLAALRELLAAAHGDAAGALDDLRDLVRGIHPPVLDNGLPEALASLAAASAIPVRVTADLPRRPSPAIEAIAYFCAAELVANAVKHSFASEVSLEVHPGPRQAIVLTVTDDGVGGAGPARGSGLAGLAERVSTVDGSLAVSSPPGGPTVVTIVLPMEA
jgi:signal transduction histidine kinase